MSLTQKRNKGPPLTRPHESLLNFGLATHLTSDLNTASAVCAKLLDEWMDGRTNIRTPVFGGAWVDAWIHVWMDGYMHRWMDGWMYGYVYGRMDICTDGSMHVWIYAWMDVLMYEGMNRPVHLILDRMSTSTKYSI